MTVTVETKPSISFGTPRQLLRAGISALKELRALHGTFIPTAGGCS